MTTAERDELVNAIANHLDTRDKRYMFLKIFFKDQLSHIQIEGNPWDAAWNIYFEFQKQSMLGSLMACVNNTFDTDLQITYK